VVFDPIHSGHLSLLKEAKSIAGEDGIVIVGLNSNAWLIRKKGAFFMPYNERATILSAIRYVDMVSSFDDSDGSACGLIKIARSIYPTEEIIFVNGGDRTSDNIPESSMEQTHNIRFLFGVGGADKKNSSSWILENWSRK
jgi:D-beta-D-heptose 7-phosphate kinase/D-beta-D-heptose 1-phosphate adenosyltransferase